MAIKLNGVGITSNKLNSSNVTLENLDGVKVWPTATTKKWVLIGEYTSTGFFLPFYEIISASESATAELMEQKFPANNYSVGHLGEIKWWETFYLFQVQEV